MIIFKFLGMVFIVVGTTMVGFNYANYFHKRTKQLRQWQSALNILRAEITYGHTPLFLACQRIEKQVASPTGEFFSIFSKELATGKESITVLFKKALDDTWKKTALCLEEYSVLLQFGESLGLHDPMSQEKQIALTLDHLQVITESAVLEQRKNEKVFRTLGILAGFLLILLFL